MLRIISQRLVKSQLGHSDNAEVERIRQQYYAPPEPDVQRAPKRYWLEAESFQGEDPLSSSLKSQFNSGERSNPSDDVQISINSAQEILSDPSNYGLPSGVAELNLHGEEGFIKAIRLDLPESSPMLSKPMFQ